MDKERFKDSPSGRLVATINHCHAFIPHPLQKCPEFDLDRLLVPLEKASRAVGELSGIGRTLPSANLLIRPFSRREALTSSRIEGTVTSVEDLLSLEAGADPATARADTREVANYARALEHGLGRVDKLPVSKRLIQELHSILLKGVAMHRGAQVEPGEFKKDQNWIGGATIENARFVPPPAIESINCLDELEKYIHSDVARTPLLIKLALIHYQFEAIHPFPDGNGRVGRLLIPLILCEQKALAQPLLYLSPYLEQHFREYIDCMFQVSCVGAWDDWIEFFLIGIFESATSGIATAKALGNLREKYLGLLQSIRNSALLARLLDDLFKVPATTIPYAQRDMNVSYNSAASYIDKFVNLGILTPSESSKRPQWFFAHAILELTSA